MAVDHTLLGCVGLCIMLLWQQLVQSVVCLLTGSGSSSASLPLPRAAGSDHTPLLPTSHDRQPIYPSSSSSSHHAYSSLHSSL